MRKLGRSTVSFQSIYKEICFRIFPIWQRVQQNTFRLFPKTEHRSQKNHLTKVTRRENYLHFSTPLNPKLFLTTVRGYIINLKRCYVALCPIYIFHFSLSIFPKIVLLIQFGKFSPKSSFSLVLMKQRK